MKVLLSLATLLLCACLVRAQPGFSHDFDTDLWFDISMDTANPTNIWTIGTPQKVIFDEAFSAPNAIFTDTALYYPQNNYSTFQFPVDLNWFFGYPMFILEFRHKFDTDYRKDGGWVEASFDGGATWRNAFNDSIYETNVYVTSPGDLPDTLDNGVFAFTGLQETWSLLSICWSTVEPPMNSQDSMLIRFVFQSDSVQTSHEGWIIDEFRLVPTVVESVLDLSKLAFEVTVMPNPTTDLIRVNCETTGRVSYSIINALGQSVLSAPETKHPFEIDIGDFKVGIYHLMLYSESEGLVVKQIVKQ